MRHLFAAEVRRAVSRRVVRLTAFVSLVGLAVLGVAIFATADSTPPSDRTRDILVENCRYEADPAACEANLPSAEELEESPGGIYVDTDTRPHLVELWPDDDARAAGNNEALLMASSVMLLMLAVVLGASLVGADYTSRNLETLLTWEPRRLRFVAMRLCAAGVVVFAFYVVFQAAFTLTLLPTIAAKGTMEGADAAWLGNLLVMAGRTGLLVAGFGVFGAALAFLVRSTAGAMGVVFAYLVGVEAILRSFQPEWTNWYVISNLVPLLDPTTLLDFFTRTAAGAGFLLFVYLVLVVVAAAGVFRARDLG